jgi:shikimate kinase
MPERLLLVGMMGAGKTTVGRLLAQRLGWGYLDSDAQVTRTTGRSVPEIFSEDGELAFRKEETKALTTAVSGADPMVVSVAGGAVLSEANRALLARAGIVVWLRARPETLSKRVGDGAGRPLLGDDPAGALAALYEVRRPLYDSVAAVTVDVDDLSPEAVADRVLAGARLGSSGTESSGTESSGTESSGSEGGSEDRQP